MRGGGGGGSRLTAFITMVFMMQAGFSTRTKTHKHGFSEFSARLGFYISLAMYTPSPSYSDGSHYLGSHSQG